MEKGQFLKAIKEKSNPVQSVPLASIKVEEDYMVPSMNLTSNDLPLLKDKKVGDKVRFVVEAEVCEQSKGGKNYLKVKKVG